MRDAQRMDSHRKRFDECCGQRVDVRREAPCALSAHYQTIGETPHRQRRRTPAEPRRSQRAHIAFAARGSQLWFEGDKVANPMRLHAGTNRTDPAGHLVTERAWLVSTVGTDEPWVVEVVQIRPADPTPGHEDLNLAC